MANNRDYMDDITIVLVGGTGNGKSAMGNSIIGRRVFRSASSFVGVTKRCQRRSTVLKDDRVLHVIDTPGLFDSSSEPKDIQKEIVRCIDMARDGIHAVLIVVSLDARFSDEQAAVVDMLKHMFGSKIVDYMIVAFTYGEKLKRGETLDDRLALGCPKELRELLDKCGNRKVVFRNRTTDQTLKDEQRDQLLTLITDTIQKNGGKPYTHELFVQLKKEAEEKGNGNSEQQRQTYKAQIQLRLAEMVAEKLKEINNEVINKLQEELDKVRRELKAQKIEEKKAADEIKNLKKRLEVAENRWTCTLM